MENYANHTNFAAITPDLISTSGQHQHESARCLGYCSE